MKLKDFLKNNKVKTPIVIMELLENSLSSSEEYEKISKIDRKYLNAEYMEHTEEDEVTEIWVM